MAKITITGRSESLQRIQDLIYAYMEKPTIFSDYSISVEIQGLEPPVKLMRSPFEVTDHEH